MSVRGEYVLHVNTGVQSNDPFVFPLSSHLLLFHSWLVYSVSDWREFWREFWRRKGIGERYCSDNPNVVFRSQNYNDREIVQTLSNSSFSIHYSILSPLLPFIIVIDDHHHLLSFEGCFQ